MHSNLYVIYASFQNADNEIFEEDTAHVIQNTETVTGRSYIYNVERVIE